MTTKNDSIAFIGTGALGTPIAANLLASGLELTVRNRTASKTEALRERGAKIASTPAEAISRGGIVFTILWDDASLEEMVGSGGFLEGLGNGGVHVSMTTVTPACAERVAKLHEARGSTYVEAPIFGIPSAAVARELIVCLAGPKAAKARVHPLLEAMGGKRVVDLGESVGAGTATKLVGNFMIISAFGAMQEAFNVLMASGLDPKPTLDLLTTTLLATPSNQRYAAYLLSGNTMPTSAIPLKDVGLFQRFAESARTSAPLAAGVREVLLAPR